MDKVSFLENPELARERIKFSIEGHLEDGTDVPFFTLNNENAEYVIENKIIESLGYEVLNQASVEYGVRFEVRRAS
jgi:hypothetical protein